VGELTGANPVSITLKPEDILTPEELAARLKVRKSWVYEMTRSRNPNPLPRLNTGRYLRFDWAQVVEWLTEENGNDPMRKKKARR
jgi:excisionase family DNA binding protein